MDWICMVGMVHSLNFSNCLVWYFFIVKYLWISYCLVIFSKNYFVSVTLSIHKVLLYTLQEAPPYIFCILCKLSDCPSLLNCISLNRACCGAAWICSSLLLTSSLLVEVVAQVSYYEVKTGIFSSIHLLRLTDAVSISVYEASNICWQNRVNCLHSLGAGFQRQTVVLVILMQVCGEVISFQLF